MQTSGEGCDAMVVGQIPLQLGDSVRTFCKVNPRRVSRELAKQRPPVILNCRRQRVVGGTQGLRIRSVTFAGLEERIRICVVGQCGG